VPFSFSAAANGFVHICGHRGHSLGAPENTLPAFAAARDLGATTCEIDTVLSRDGVIVVMHDLLVDRTTNGEGAARDLSATEIAGLDAGSWFAPQFAGTTVPNLTEALAAAHDLGLGYEVEVKEKLDLPAYTQALRVALADPADRERTMIISFDHASLKAMKAAIPGLATGGIVHERYADPVAVARAADLDQLCIDLDVFDLADAERLHEAGITIRCHAFSPNTLDLARRAGLPWEETLRTALEAGLIDMLSGDDVGWLQSFVAED